VGELQGEWVSESTITFSKCTDVSERERSREREREREQREEEREKERERKSLHDQKIIIRYPWFDITEYLTKPNLK
jgi:hypothetical protein